MHLRWSDTRLGRALLFLAVVWSTAGAFLMLQLGLPELLGQATSRGWLDARLLMPAQPTTAAAGCSRKDPVAPASGTPAAMGEVRYAAWMLGRRWGLAAGMAAAGLARCGSDSLQPGIDTMARTLGIDPPGPPRIRSVANALHEFGLHLEADPDCVAARLSARYGPALGQLFKFGAVIGHAISYQVNGVGAVFAPQIAVYGDAAGIPRDLWLPLTSASLDDVPGADAEQKVTLMIARLDDYMRRSR